MKFLVMGSIKSDDAEMNEIGFHDACRQLGSKLAEHGHTIIVNSTDPWTADLHVLEGANKISGKHRVILLKSTGDADQNERSVYESKGYSVEGDDPQDLSLMQNLEVLTQTVGGQWPGNRIQAISEADGVIVIGGRFGVAAVGASAPLLRTPVIAVGSFGGAAAKVLSEAIVHYGKVGISPEDVRSLRSPWGSGSADAVVRVAESVVKRNPFRQGDRSVFIFAVGILMLLAGWVAVYRVGIRSPTDTAVFGLLAISALIGTGLRTELRLLANDVSLLSVRHVTVEATAGILLAFIFCLLYLAGNFVLTGTFITLQGQEATAFSRVGITLSITGISSAFLLEPAVENLRKRLGEIITK
jgi:hypothetical protein